MGNMRGLGPQSVTGDVLQRGESGLLGIYATTTLRRRGGSSSPALGTKDMQVAAFLDPGNGRSGEAVVLWRLVDMLQELLKPF